MMGVNNRPPSTDLTQHFQTPDRCYMSMVVYRAVQGGGGGGGGSSGRRQLDDVTEAEGGEDCRGPRTFRDRLSSSETLNVG